MKILVVEDVVANRLLLTKILGTEHQVVEAENGQQAIERYLEVQPDLVLMDVKMPVMDGITATRMIRAMRSEKWVPIFMLSALDDETSIVEGLEAGADDYLTKPINRTILKAKLSSAIRSLDMQSRMISEQTFAQAVFTRLLNQSQLDGKKVQVWSKSVGRFSGDLVCVERANDQRLYFMLADSTGHGLSAALPTLIVNQIFRTMAKKTIGIPEIAREMNLRLETVLPVGHFVALGLGMVDFERCSIEIWNGGLPDIEVFDTHGDVLHAFKSMHVFAGVMHDENFDDTAESWQWSQDCELLAFSDGLMEACNARGEMFGETRKADVIANARLGKRIDALQVAMDHFIDARIEHDDITCLSIRCTAAGTA